MFGIESRKERKKMQEEKVGRKFIKSFLVSAIEDAFCCGDDEDVRKYIELYESVDNWNVDIRTEEEQENFVEQVKRVMRGL